jgi:hypothetical protein
MRGMPTLVVQDYIRQQDREDTPEPGEQRRDDMDDALPTVDDGYPETVPF